jgi:two-component system, NtrC family, response regulator AtoC
LQHTMHRVARHYSLPAREFPSSVVQACQHHSWPGNLRELESFVKRYLVSGDAELAFNDLGEVLPAASDAAQAVTPSSRGDVAQVGNGVKSLKTLIQNVKSEAERNAIGTALQKTGWNRKAAARLLQVSYRTLLYKIDQYHMNSSETFLSPLPPIRLSLQGTATRSGGKE